MTSKLVPLKKSPLASAWTLRTVTDRLDVYVSRNGKRVAYDRACGQWYRITK